MISSDEIDVDSLNLLQNKILVCYDSLLDAVNFRKRKNDEYEAIRKKRYNVNAESYSPIIFSDTHKTLKKLLDSFDNKQK